MPAPLLAGLAARGAAMRGAAGRGAGRLGAFAGRAQFVPATKDTPARDDPRVEYLTDDELDALRNDGIK